MSIRKIPARSATQESAGVFNKRIYIQAPPINVDDGRGGNSNKTWTTVVTTWAHISIWKGAERFIAQQQYANSYLRIVIRYRPGLNIDASMRITYKNHIYNIRNVAVPEEAQTTIDLLCEELQASGSV